MLHEIKAVLFKFLNYKSAWGNTVSQISAKGLGTVGQASKEY